MYRSEYTAATVRRPLVFWWSSARTRHKRRIRNANSEVYFIFRLSESAADFAVLDSTYFETTEDRYG